MVIKSKARDHEAFSHVRALAALRVLACDFRERNPLVPLRSASTLVAGGFVGGVFT